MAQKTIFVDKDGNELGHEEGLLNIPLVKDMIITIGGHSEDEFMVVEWQYHHGTLDEDSKLKIILRKKPQGMKNFIKV